ncbi:MAG: DNA alkylation repair protein [Candidatus Magasanikbacteria bacterium]|nr:DNA alkylation repair protein [Candidatus Magasanikbacteria bacterium]
MPLSTIRRELKSHIEPAYKTCSLGFFKEPVKLYGVRAPIVKKIAKNYFKLLKDLPKKNIYKISEQLLASNYNEEASIAFDWAFRLRVDYTKAEFKTFEKWIKTYVTNWGMCDDLCTHALGYLISKFPELIPQIKKWVKSKNRWVRRASAVSLIVSVRGKKCLDDVLKAADLLLMDQDNMVQKGYGWMLKEASNVFPTEVFEFVMKRKNKMPRTALRYAIEKFPESKRKILLAK